MSPVIKVINMLILFVSDIFQKLSAVVEQREWIVACGAHKVSGAIKYTYKNTTYVFSEFSTTGVLSKYM